MGIVRLGNQRAFDRNVAVKCLRQSASIGTRFALLREARVTGALEHPNVVPVYDLGVDGSGSPILVMKRIAGETWADIMADLVRPLEPRQFERHLNLVLAIATACHFAHERGFIHRDLKPNNIMIGEFGEVYLLDWGIAASTSPATENIAPTPSEACDIVGTPAYMAPEMAAPGIAPIGTATDVYLLGGLLYFLLVGSPPHNEATVLETLAAAFGSEPPILPPETPPELAAICLNAMAHAPGERYADAGAFRQALQTYLDRRPSLALMQEGRECFERWLVTRDGLDESPEAGSEIDRQLRTLFGEARFALQRALKEWPTNQEARQLLQDVLTRSIEYELSVGAFRAAHALADAMPTADTEVLALIGRVEGEYNQRQERLNQLEYDTDVTLSRRLRAVVIIVFGIFSLVSNAATGMLDRAGSLPNGHIALAVQFALFALLIPIAWNRAVKSRWAAENHTNRILIKSVVIVMVALSVLTAAMGAMKVELTVTFIVIQLAGIGFWALVATLADGTLWTLVVAISLGVLLVAFLPEYRFEWYGLTGGGGVVAVGLLWVYPTASENAQQVPLKDSTEH